MFEKLPLPISTLVLFAGVATTVWGFIYYNDPTLNLIGIFAGIPLLLGGVTMKVVELKPVPALAVASAEVMQARAQQATEIQKQVRADITKYSYGANAHLEDALEFLGLRGPLEADLPKVKGYQEELRNGRYALVLLFDSPAVPFEQWQESHQKKMQGFFGRDVEVQLAQPQENQVELALIAQPAFPTT
ncbi:DUF2854 domain-containing protein [Synechococcus sp. Nb3U1]|uniref:DUF2854 domain-containing protein n=1 Tax=Synechococcus sp. Nb3U1 TaxID=1914529 RepID=UPI001F27ABD4|nr:DUF2854 domain-containing protein [Synechococcus sp. Nb3U1]MCF2972108.1 DUF2854 domain-containing protein [Synechococcus sp. Nb3U1]